MKMPRFAFALIAILTLVSCTAPPAVTASPVAPAASPAPTQPQPANTAALPAPGSASCLAQTGFFPTPEPAMQAAFPPPTDEDWVLGNPDARLTIIEYSDFQ